MGFFSSLFRKSEELDVKDQEEVVQQKRYGEFICEACGLIITGNQRVKTFNGKKFHLKPCWRDIMKKAKQTAFS